MNAMRAIPLALAVLAGQSTEALGAIALKTACPKPTVAQCKDPAYFKTTCGKAELTKNQGNPSWVCLAAYSAEHSALLTSPGVAVGDTLVPETTVQGPVTTTQYLEHATAAIKPDAGHFAAKPYGCFSGAYTASSTGLTVDPCLLVATQAVPLSWDLNGGAVASCAEYAFEKFYDFSRLELQTAGAKHDARAVYDAVTNPASPVRLSHKAAVLSRSGKTSHPLPFAACAPGNSFARYLDPPDPATCTPESWTWHQQMSAAMAAAGHSDEVLSYLLEKQQDFDKTVGMKLMAETQQALLAPKLGSYNPYTAQQAWLESQQLSLQLQWWNEQIGAALQVADDELGCLSTGGALTPCDWSPALLRDNLYRHYRDLRREAQNTCEHMTGGSLTNLKSRFLDVNGDSLGYAMSATGTKLPVVNYTASTEGFDTWVSHMQQHRVWLNGELLKLKKSLPLDASGKVTTAQARSGEDAMGNELFGTAYRYSSLWAVQDPTPTSNVCDATVIAETTAESRAAILSHDFELLYGHARLTPARVTAELRVLGMSLAAVDQAIPSGSYAIVSERKRWEDEQTLFQANFPVFGIPIGVSAGVAGHVGLDVDVKADLGAPVATASGCRTTLKVVGTVTPRAGVEAFATVAIDLLIVRAGIKGRLTILELELPLDAALGLTFKWNANGTPDYMVNAAASLDLVLRTLSGRLSLFGELRLLVTTLTAEVTLVRWNGFQTKVPLFDTSFGSTAPLSVIQSFNN